MDDVAILRVETIETDAIGNEIKTYTDKQVFVKTRGVTRREFYDAQQAGLRPSLVLVLSNRADYAKSSQCSMASNTRCSARTGQMTATRSSSHSKRG